MALLHFSYYSQALLRTVPVQVVLPVDRVGENGYLPPDRPFPTLYLLHGYTGEETDWVVNTRIAQWAAAKGLAVVMPAGENAFYVDHPYGNFGELVGRELVEMTRRMFPLSHRREETFLAGLSMGGFGALRNGLKYHETFGKIGAFSAALDYFELPPRDGGLLGKYLSADLPEVADTDVNPRVAYEAMARSEAVPTKIYMTCGTEDPLVSGNRSFRDFLTENGGALTYVERPGIHDWEFWNQAIQDFLDWLSLD